MCFQLQIPRIMPEKLQIQLILNITNNLQSILCLFTLIFIRLTEALNDLNRALELANEQQPRTKCHAHCQRGILFRKLENLDAARADFEAAAQLGSKFAREQVGEK